MSTVRPGRAGHSAVLAVLAAVFVAQAVLTLGAFVPVLARDRAATVDHVSLAVAAELVADDPASLYDLRAQRAVQDTLDPAGPDRPFANPPFVATGARLVEAAGIRVGYLALVVVDLLAVGLLAALVWRQGRSLSLTARVAATAGALAAFPVASVMAEGGVSGLAATGIALVLWGEHHRRPWVAAAGLALAATKPHLLPAALVVLAFRGRWGVLGRGVLIGTAMALPSLATPGLGAWLAYPSVLTGVAGSGSPAVQHSEHWWNIASLLHHGLGRDGSPTAVVLTWSVLVVGVAAIATAARATDGTAAMAAALVLGLLVSPHTNPADALWLPLAFVLVRTDPGWDRRSPFGRAAIGGLAAAWPVASLTAFTWSTAGGSVAAVTMMLAFAVLTVAGHPRRLTATATTATLGGPVPGTGPEPGHATPVPAVVAALHGGG